MNDKDKIARMVALLKRWADDGVVNDHIAECEAASVLFSPTRELHGDTLDTLDAEATDESTDESGGLCLKCAGGGLGPEGETGCTECKGTGEVTADKPHDEDFEIRTLKTDPDGPVPDEPPADPTEASRDWWRTRCLMREKQLRELKEDLYQEKEHRDELHRHNAGSWKARAEDAEREVERLNEVGSKLRCQRALAREAVWNLHMGLQAEYD